MGILIRCSSNVRKPDRRRDETKHKLRLSTNNKKTTYPPLLKKANCISNYPKPVRMHFATPNVSIKVFASYLQVELLAPLFTSVYYRLQDDSPN